MSNNILSSIVSGPVTVYPQEKEFIEQVVLGAKFPWFWKSSQSFDSEFFHNQYIPKWFDSILPHYNSQFFSHTLLRNAENSNDGHQHRGPEDFSVYYEFFIELFHRFIVENNIKYTKIFRANLNFNWHNDITHTEPHLDHSWEHKNFIMYLNTCEDGQTLIWPEDFSATYFVPAIQYTAVTFKQQWHAHRYPAPGSRRVVFVVTYI
jgi:hypothetical protein